MPPQHVNPPSSLQGQQTTPPVSSQNTWNKFALFALETFVLSLLILWINPLIRYFGGIGIITIFIGIILPFLTLFFAIKAIRGIHKNGGKGKALSWIVLLLNLVMLFFAIVSAPLFFTISSLVTNPNSLPPDGSSNIPPANEIIEVLGPTPETERSEYKKAAQYNNNLNFYFTESGDTVGYRESGGDYWYYVQNNSAHGPIVAAKSTQGYETDEHFFSRIEALGWPAGMQERWKTKSSDSKSGHTLERIKTGTDYSTFDIQVPSQATVLYDGNQVGLHTIQDGKAESPVEGVVLSNDGLHWAYLVRAKHGFYVVVDGRKSSTYPMLSNLHFEGSTFVFNVVSSDFMNFVRVKI